MNTVLLYTITLGVYIFLTKTYPSLRRKTDREGEKKKSIQFFQTNWILNCHPELEVNFLLWRNKMLKNAQHLRVKIVLIKKQFLSFIN